MGNIIGLVIIFNVILVIHELGHYWAARRIKFPVQTVCFGLGKPIITWRRGDTTFAVAPVPLGGYIKMDDEAYAALPASHKAWIAFWGPIANLFSVVVFISGLLFLHNLVELGLAALTPPILFKSLVAGVEVLVNIVVYLFWGIVELSNHGGLAQAVVGPVGLAHQVQSVGQLSMAMWLALFSGLSVNIALFNLLPIPALDGGRITFALLEMVMGKPIAKEETIHQWGFILLLTLGLFLTLKDTLAILISSLF